MSQISYIENTLSLKCYLVSGHLEKGFKVDNGIWKVFVIVSCKTALGRIEMDRLPCKPWSDSGAAMLSKPHPHYSIEVSEPASI